MKAFHALELQEVSSSPKSYGGVQKLGKHLELPETPSTAVPTAFPTPMASPSQGRVDLLASWEEAMSHEGKVPAWLTGRGLAGLELGMPGLQPPPLPPALILTAPSNPPSCAMFQLPSPLGARLGQEGFELRGFHGAGARPRPLGRVAPSRAVATEALLLRGSEVLPEAARSAAQVLVAAAPSRKLLARTTRLLASSGDKAVWPALARCARPEERRALLRRTFGAESSHEAGLVLWDYLQCEKAFCAPLLLAGSGTGSTLAQLRRGFEQLSGGRGKVSWFAEGLPAAAEVATASSVELVLAAKGLGKALLQVGDLQDLSPGALTSCLLLAVDQKPGSPQCLISTALKSPGSAPIPSLSRLRGAPMRRRVIMVDDLSLPMQAELASKPEALWGGSCQAPQALRETREGHYKLLQAVVRRAPELALRVPSAARCLESAKFQGLLHHEEQIPESPARMLWETFLKAEQRALAGTRLQLVASTKLRAALASVASCSTEDVSEDPLQERLAMPALQPGSWLLPPTPDSDFEVDFFNSLPSMVLATATSLAQDMGLCLDCES